MSQLRTRVTLIEQLKHGGDDAWIELERVYKPLMLNWLGRFNLQSNDVEDLTQDVLTILAQEIGRFDHNGRVGAFRNWMRTITVNRVRTFLRSDRLRPSAPGTTSFLEFLDQLDDPNSDVSRQFGHDHDLFVLNRLLELVSAEFESSTMTAFRRHVLDGLPAKEVAESLGVTTQTVYVTKSRVLRRLRERAQGILEDSAFS